MTVSDRFIFREQVLIFLCKQAYLDDQFYFRFILTCFHLFFFFSKILVTYQNNWQLILRRFNCILISPGPGSTVLWFPSEMYNEIFFSSLGYLRVIQLSYLKSLRFKQGTLPTPCTCTILLCFSLSGILRVAYLWFMIIRDHYFLIFDF